MKAITLQLLTDSGKFLKGAMKGKEMADMELQQAL